jgi:hypothetical protein
MNQVLMTQYRQLMMELLLDRELSGPLSQEVESERAAALDAIWWQLTDEEQHQLEYEFVRVPEAPDSLGMEDVDIQIGDTIAPRSYVSSEEVG